MLYNCFWHLNFIFLTLGSRNKNISRSSQRCCG